MASNIVDGAFTVEKQFVIRVSDREVLQDTIFRAVLEKCDKFPNFRRGDTIAIDYDLWTTDNPDNVIRLGEINEYHEITEVAEPLWGGGWTVRAAKFLVAGIFTRLILSIVPRIMEPGFAYKIRAGIKV